MHICRLFRQILPFFLLLAPIFLQSGCTALSNLPFFKAKQPSFSSKYAPAEQVVLTQSLAILALDKDQNKLKTYVKNLNTYGKAKEKEAQIAVLSLEFTLKDQPGKRRLLVPVPVNAKTPSFNALRQVQSRLSALPYTLQNLHAYYVPVSFPASQKFSSDSSVLQQQLEEEQQKMIEEATPLSSHDSARLQLQLAEFFIAMRVRDAAYLSLENAKGALADMAENAPEVNIVSLSQQADSLESRLRKEMPYKL